MRRLSLGAAAMSAALALSCLHLGVPAAVAEQPRPVWVTPLWDKRNVDIAKVFDAVVETIDRKFFDVARLNEVGWRTRAAAVRPSVLAAETVEDAVGQINALLAELKTSHTALLTPEDYQYYILLDIMGAGAGDLMTRRFWGSTPHYPGIGAFTRLVDGRHFVDGVLEGSPADRAGVKYGDELLSVDERPYSPISAFHGKAGSVVELKVRRHAEADTQSLFVEVLLISPRHAFSAATLASARVIEQFGRRIGYIHIWASVDRQSLYEAMQKIGLRSYGATTSTPDFLIVDMRGRVGGNIAVTKAQLEALDGGHNPYWGIGRYTTRPGWNVRITSEPSFRGRSALLIDHHTRSAAEIMAYGYKRSAFGPVIGTPTAGAVSSGGTHALPGDLLLYVASSGLEFNGRALEGVGVAPDHHVERPLPYAAGADPVLEAALELAVK